jgi:hypothetical protein
LVDVVADADGVAVVDGAAGGAAGVGDDVGEAVDGDLVGVPEVGVVVAVTASMPLSSTMPTQ